MSFLNPIFLIAVVTAAIPLFIYLLNIRKPERMRFSSLSFFDLLKTTAIRRIRIKRWLLLALRMTAMILLAVALARPFLPPGIGWFSQSEPKIIGLLIDNSPGMAQVDQHGPYFEQAIAVAQSVVEMSDHDSRFVIEVTNGDFLNLPPVSRVAALRHLSALQPVNGGNYTLPKINRLREALNREEEVNKIIYLITDGQESQFHQLAEEEPTAEPESNIYLQAFTVGDTGVMNLGISSVELEYAPSGSGTDYQIRARVENFGTRPAANAYLTFFLEDEMIARQMVTMPAGEYSDVVFDIPARESEWIRMMFEIEGDELSFDNRHYTVLRQPSERDVLVIGEGRGDSAFPSLLQPLLAAASEETKRFKATFVNLEELNTVELTDYNAIIFDGLREIPDYLVQSATDHVQNGAGLFMIPAADGNMNSYNRFLQQAGAGQYAGMYGSYGSFDPVDRVAEPLRGNPVLDEIFAEEEQSEIRINVPEIYYYYLIDPDSRAVPILANRSGNIVFAETQLGNGKLVYSAIGIDPGWSDFSAKPFFAPFFFRITDYLMLGEGAQLQTHTLGQEFRLEAVSPGQELFIKYGDEAILPEISAGYSGSVLRYEAKEWQPGWFSLEESSGTEIFVGGINQHTMESEVGSLSAGELSILLRNFFKNAEVIESEGTWGGDQQEFRTAAFGKEIWYWFIITAFILLLTESLISRHYKAESIG